MAYRAILVALQSVSGVSVSVSERDREFIPVGVTTVVTKDAGEPAPVPASPWASLPAPTKTVTTTPGSKWHWDHKRISAPAGADVYVDARFVGNSPAELQLSPGSHTSVQK